MLSNLEKFKPSTSPVCHRVSNDMCGLTYGLLVQAYITGPCTTPPTVNQVIIILATTRRTIPPSSYHILGCLVRVKDLTFSNSGCDKAPMKVFCRVPFFLFDLTNSSSVLKATSTSTLKINSDLVQIELFPELGYELGSCACGLCG